MLSAIDRNHWPPSIGIGGRFRRNPQNIQCACHAQQYQLVRREVLRHRRILSRTRIVIGIKRKQHAETPPDSRPGILHRLTVYDTLRAARDTMAYKNSAGYAGSGVAETPAQGVPSRFRRRRPSCPGCQIRPPVQRVAKCGRRMLHCQLFSSACCLWVAAVCTGSGSRAPQLPKFSN